MLKPRIIYDAVGSRKAVNRIVLPSDLFPGPGERRPRRPRHRTGKKYARMHRIETLSPENRDQLTALLCRPKEPPPEPPAAPADGDIDAAPEPPEPDPYDVLAMLVTAPLSREPISTGTPLDALVASSVVPGCIARGAFVVLRGFSEAGKTTLLLASVAHLLRAGDHVIVHVDDREPRVACYRLARLLGCEPEQLAAKWPRLRVRTEDLAGSVAMVGPGQTLALDSLQTAAEELQLRRDAPPHERIDAARKMLRPAARRGALVLATSELGTAGDDRNSKGVRFGGDVIVDCDRDAKHRFSVALVKPQVQLGCEGTRWYVLDARGAPVDWTAPSTPAEQVAQFAQSTPKPRKPGRRSAGNRAAVPDEVIRERVAALLADDPGISQSRVVAAVRANEHRVRAIYQELRGGRK